jgi:hypothetical protein
VVERSSSNVDDGWINPFRAYSGSKNIYRRIIWQNPMARTSPRDVRRPRFASAADVLELRLDRTSQLATIVKSRTELIGLQTSEPGTEINESNQPKFVSTSIQKGPVLYLPSYFCTHT